jgi:hypothetical protein
MKKAAVMILALALPVVFATTAAAQEPVEYEVTVKGDVVKGSPSDHFLTFATPVSMPDVTLPAGTYIFTIRESSIVQVRSADRSQAYGLFFTMPVESGEWREQHAITLAGETRRITKWFLPDRTTGFEFLYAEAEVSAER